MDENSYVHKNEEPRTKSERSGDSQTGGDRERGCINQESKDKLQFGICSSTGVPAGGFACLSADWGLGSF